MSKLVLVLDPEFSKYPPIHINFKNCVEQWVFQEGGRNFWHIFCGDAYTCLRFFKKPSRSRLLTGWRKLSI
jgi:hypothetical protein